MKERKCKICGSKLHLDGYRYGEYICEYNNVIDDKVIAWKEIEQFKECE